MPYLFERLSEPAARAPAGFDVVAAIRCQLMRVLVSHPGTVGEGEPHLLEFGLPSVPDIRVDDAPQIDSLRDRVKRLIQHYEPRLTEVQVSVEPTGDALAPYRILVDAKVIKEQGGQRLRFPLVPSLH